MTKLQHKESNKELLETSKILIIDDDRVERMMLRQIFENYGFQHVHEADDGQKGWEKTLEVDPDLILLDINMPIMDGFTFIKKARANPDYEEAIILVQTGLTDLKDKAKIFESGATDYVTKPLDFHEIAARSLIHLKNALNVKSLKAFNKMVKNELSAAKNLIEMSLPNERAIKDFNRRYQIGIASKFESSMDLGGDFWGACPINNNQLAIYNIDVSGHGIDSALSALRIHTLLHSNSDQFREPGDMLELLNNKLFGLFPIGQFATMFYGIIDIKEDKLMYATAATPNPIILYKNDTSPKFLSGRGFPLGAEKEATFKTECVPFKPEDSIVLYSDAITEAIANDGEMFGEERLLELLKKAATQKNFSAKAIMDEVLSLFHKECGDKLNDDLTFNIYHRLP